MRKKIAILGFKKTIKNPDPTFPNKVLVIWNLWWSTSESEKLDLNITYASQSKNNNPAKLRKLSKNGTKESVTVKPKATKKA